MNFIKLHSVAGFANALFPARKRFQVVLRDTKVEILSWLYSPDNTLLDTMEECYELY